MMTTMTVLITESDSPRSFQSYLAKLSRFSTKLSGIRQVSTKPSGIRLSQAGILILCTVGLSVISETAYAEPITVTALAHNSEARYAEATHLPYANPNAPKGGQLSRASLGTFNSANPWMTTGLAMAGTEYMYDTLMTGSLNEAYTMYPQLADKVTYDPEDASWVIYHINPQARFWDGSPVTADDVVATYDAFLHRGLMQVRSYLAAVDRVEALDTQRVKFHFVSDDNKEALITVSMFPIFAKKSVDADFERLSLMPLMGSGPYRLMAVDEGRSVTYQRDPNYWGLGLMVNQGRYNFDKLKFIYYGNDDISFEGFKVGQYQFRLEHIARKWAVSYDFPALRAGLIKKETILNANPVAMQGLVMNLRHDMFKDIRVREALTEAFDFELLNKTLFYNQYERLQSYFHGSELAAIGPPSANELAILEPFLSQLSAKQRQGVLSDWQLPTTPDNGYHRQALLNAREKLLAAGFYYQDMMLVQPNGEPAKLEILIPSDSLSRVLLPYIRHLKRLGFDASIRLVDMPQYSERLRNFDYDMIMAQFAQGLSPGAEQAYFWGSAAADEPGNRNYSGIKNPVIDSVIDKLIAADSRDEVVLYSRVLDRLLLAGYYMVPTYGTTHIRVAYWDKYRHVAQLPNGSIGLDYWWVDKDAAQKVAQYLD